MSAMFVLYAQTSGDIIRPMRNKRTRTALIGLSLITLLLAALVIWPQPAGWRAALERYSDPLTVCMNPDLTAEEVAAYRGLAVQDVKLIEQELGKSKRAICLTSGKKLAREILQANGVR